MVERRLFLLVSTMAVGFAVVYKGFSLTSLCLVESLLFLGLLIILWQSYDRGLPEPVTGISVCLTLLWLWMGISIFVGSAPVLSLQGFLMLGSLPLAFWLYTWLGDRESFWGQWAWVLLSIGLLLAAFALYQELFTNGQPIAFFVQRNSLGAFLNLLTLPVAALFLQQRSRWRRVCLGLAVFVLFYAIALIRSYGVGIGFWLGLGLILILNLKTSNRRDLLLLLGLALLAHLLVRLHTGEGLDYFAADHITRNVSNSTISRWTIWEAALRVVHDAPWYGKGLYSFSLAYAPYMPMTDTSSGQYAHNDYLQFWIELGFPGLVLVFALLVAVFFRFVRWLRFVSIDHVKRGEVIGIFAGLLAIAAHSFVSYNFYILPTLLLFGLMLGRFHDLTLPDRARLTRFKTTTVFSRNGYRLIIVATLLLPLFLIATLAGSSYYQERAKQQMEHGKLLVAERSLNIAAKLFDTEHVEYTRAMLYIAAIRGIPDLPAEERKSLYESTTDALNRAVRMNPLRSNTRVARGLLYESAHDLAGKNWSKLAQSAYLHAIMLNPRSYEARMAVAKLLLHEDRPRPARAILEQGWGYGFREGKGLLAYGDLIVKARRQTGDKRGAALLKTSLQNYKQRHRKTH